MDQLLLESLVHKRSVIEYAKKNGFPIDQLNNQRILGPRIGGTCPPEGTEVFITKLPRDIFEDELVPYFETAGKVYKCRLMLCISEITNRGVAYITYETKEAAELAVRVLDHSEIKPNCYISVAKSIDNRRIFVGGIPDHKKKDEIWHELKRCGMTGIVDVIMYRSYTDRNRNRGFVFVEFRTHQEAAWARHNFSNLILFKQRVQIDWSTPIQSVEPDVMKKVKKLFLRNLSVYQEREEFAKVIVKLLGASPVIDKIYKHRDYAFIHFKTRRDAQRGISVLKNFYAQTDVEVTWANPPPQRDEILSSPSNRVDHYSRNIYSRPPRLSDNIYDTNFVHQSSPPEKVRIGNIYDTNFVHQSSPPEKVRIGNIYDTNFVHQSSPPEKVRIGNIYDTNFAHQSSPPEKVRIDNIYDTNFVHQSSPPEKVRIDNIYDTNFVHQSSQPEKVRIDHIYDTNFVHQSSPPEKRDYVTLMDMINYLTVLDS